MLLSCDRFAVLQVVNKNHTLRIRENSGHLTEDLPSDVDPLSYLSDFSVSGSFQFSPVEPWEPIEALREIKNKQSLLICC